MLIQQLLNYFFCFLKFFKNRFLLSLESACALCLGEHREMSFFKILGFRGSFGKKSEEGEGRNTSNFQLRKTIPNQK
jgi:hypothetical protein